MDSKSKFKLEKFPILKIVQHYIKTTQKGCNHWAVCPFHKDTSPSMSISEEKGIFKCFACEAAGDAVGFVMKYEKCKYSTAIVKIGEILGIDVGKYLNSRDSLGTKIHRINEIAAWAYHKYLFNEGCREKLEYLTQQRGIKVESIEKYMLGYAPESDILGPILKLKSEEKQEFGEMEVRKSNLYQTLPKGEVVPTFKDRFIFPIFSKDNKIIAFSGRGNFPKYLNIKTNEVFSKKDSIFNIQNLKSDLPIYIFEGFIDMIKSEQLGIENGVACMGGTIDASMLNVFKEYSSIIHLCLDNDSAGKKFTNNLSFSLIEKGFRVLICDFESSGYKDIDELIQGDPEVAKSILNSPKCYFDWLYEKSKHDTLEDVQILVEKCMSILFRSGRLLKGGVNREYAKGVTAKIHSWYEKIENYGSLGIAHTVERRLEDRLKAIERSVLLKVGEKNVRKDEGREISGKLKYGSITDRFLKLAIKYANLPEYYVNNREVIDAEGEWRIKAPEEFSGFGEELNLILECLDKGELDEEIREIGEFYEHYVKKIEDVGEFFNVYLSMLLMFTDEIIRVINGNQEIPGEDRYVKVYRLREERRRILAEGSEFFRKSSFFRRVEDEVPEENRMNVPDLSWITIDQ